MRNWLSKWLGWFRVVAFLGLLFGLAIRIGDPVPLSALRSIAFDVYHQSKPRQPTAQPVAIIDVDDRSLSEIGQWPWPRTRIAEIVDRATAAGAVAIAFDIVFAEPDRLSPAYIAADNPDLPEGIATALRTLPDNDAVLAEAFARSRVVTGQTSVRTRAGNRAEKQAMADIPHAVVGVDPAPFLLRFPDIVQNLPVLEANAAGHGMFTTRPDADGVYRRAPMVMSVQSKLRLGLAPELLRVATGGGPFVLRANAAGIESIAIARQPVTTDFDGTVWPYLTPSSQARYVSATDLLNDRMPPDRLAGHLVLVGTSAIGLEDFRPTPLGIAMAGVEIHAQVLENILGQTLLERPNYTIAVELVTTFFLCLLVILYAPVLAARWVIGSAVVLLSSYVAISYFLFHQHRILLDPSYPVLSVLITFMIISSVNYLREERQRRAIRSAFGQYVSPDLVDQLSRNPEALRLGGETRELTLLFSDVRGFTAIAEDFKDDPEALTQLMNDFLTILCDAILENSGTIDKFMGDAVMAFWNAPLPHDDHAMRACRTALQMTANIRKFNRRRAATQRLRRMKGRRGKGKRTDTAPVRKAHAIRVGIGINTGVCVVGNMGSNTRFDYTALGDPVNVASRLEGQSRYYGAQIVLGSATARAVQDCLAVLELDTVRVVGKDLPENIFALVGDEALRETPEFRLANALNRDMLAAYRARDWDRTEALLAEVRSAYRALKLQLDAYVDLYARRVADLRSSPPADDWDGVFSFTAKRG
ncbi:adenylate cyclase [Cribrihabitans marinus]|uniref:Adenylate cyclase n=1 Tax=Cribrihabitans marinus TaxID=1227549 RepID=A0A1H7AV99_9RHOB|nr:adenylate/guanylate cyclase domain-containing protein [Cribrihabitans marinus]GGH32497.1 guanylate cyclase [Cribrihabitans marinus]SEJ68866.1 adenylate cyclase [Cribrihabitans marinus]